MIAKHLVVLFANLVIPIVVKKYASPVHKVVAFLFYIMIVYPANLFISVAWGIKDDRFLYLPGFFFFFYWMYMLSDGYISKQGGKKLLAFNQASSQIAAQESLNMAVKMMASGKTDKAQAKFNEVAKFFRGTPQAQLAETYLSQLAEPSADSNIKLGGVLNVEPADPAEAE
jgi:hypothetical protein